MPRAGPASARSLGAGCLRAWPVVMMPARAGTPHRPKSGRRTPRNLADRSRVKPGPRALIKSCGIALMIVTMPEKARGSCRSIREHSRSGRHELLRDRRRPGRRVRRVVLHGANAVAPWPTSRSPRPRPSCGSCPTTRYHGHSQKAWSQRDRLPFPTLAKPIALRAASWACRRPGAPAG